MDFKPTWLYIKQHNSTGLMYFGKTTRKDPAKYLGSGVYWTRHLKCHGIDVSTIWSKLFTDKESLVTFALKFSEDNCIVESAKWANLKPEDGLMGGDTGITELGRKAISEKSSGRTHTDETKEKIKRARSVQSPTMLGKLHSEETKEKIRAKRALQIITPESIAKRSEKMKGIVFSKERNMKISVANKGRVFSEEHKQKLSAAAKARHTARNAP